MRIFMSAVGIIVVGLTMLSPARADAIFDFTFNGESGFSTVFGPVSGTIDLPFVNPGGSGTGAASSVTLTSIPSAFTLADGNTLTLWPDQIANSFTVTGGVITGDQFFALTGNNLDTTSLLCLNNTSATIGILGPFSCTANLNELETSSAAFESNLNGLPGITFTAAGGTAATPEPRLIGLLCAGAGLLFFLQRSRLNPVNLR
jgi:hypothetical protein